MGKHKKSVPKDETKREKFKRIVEPRVRKALKAIRLIGNCSGSAYEYSEKDVADISAVLQSGVEQVTSSYESKGVVTTDFNLD